MTYCTYNADMENAKGILVVDDDETIVRLVLELLEREGLFAEACHSASEALRMLHMRSYDLLVLDIMMPEMDGFELCREIRRTSLIPILFLTAKDAKTDKVTGLTLGADDYITKPFEPQEFIARIKAHLRRAEWSQKNTVNKTILTVQNLSLSPARHECHINDTLIALAPKEFELLRVLMEEPSAFHSVQELFERVWGETYDESGGNSVMVHIRRLRKKLASIDSTHTYITTVWGVGYKIQEKDNHP